MHKAISLLVITLRRGMYVSLGMVDTLRGKKTLLFILCYHGIANDKWRFSVSYRMFRQHMIYLSKHYAFVSLDDIQKFIDGKKKISRPSVAITFDDGYADVLQTKPLLKQLHCKPGLFVLSQPKKANHQELDNNKQFLSREELLVLKKSGWSIGSHSSTHANLVTLSEKAMDNEIKQSKKKLEKDLGMRVNYFAYPKGNYNARVLGAVKRAGYSMALSMDDGTIMTGMNQLTVPRIGVDRSHSFIEFTQVMSPSVIVVRNLIKRLIIRRAL